ncbi:MAG: L-fuculose phosphate aldolase [Acidimicrobiales bacterium]|nr:MAG: fuculose phosphate aldolase [Actinomycetota bacterium]MBV6507662.1 L-fuculose phosphate aldolase [Acidimicrobiales bacterium]RIK07592.1 MAG: fuculose phosphate aldolase [Acidobacteriota bacterium]
MHERVLKVAKEMLAKNLVSGTAGNVSGRLADGNVVMTPSSMGYEEMTLEDLCVVDLDGNKVEGKGDPSSEKALHLAQYRAYDEVGGVMHCHPIHGSMFALTHEPIPATIEEFVVYVGGEVPICEYKPAGSDELATEVASKLGERAAALMANHGMVSVGADPENALHVAEVVERCAHVIWGARQMGSTVHELPREVNDNFAGVYRFVRENRL